MFLGVPSPFPVNRAPPTSATELCRPIRYAQFNVQFMTCVSQMKSSTSSKLSTMADAVRRQARLFEEADIDTFKLE